ncbi:MAG: hypothetical protein NBV68_12975 [Erythrobacter sp.]|uniref:hypothetical protein n=1 Tax=Erythrobacter sp. TaxID=1042 RepID=UPI0025DF31BD|nr:hypothetical protein [Erythrobacter sp.]MCM0000291.1 hypothetical protein [Erythrobacter sp.]
MIGVPILLLASPLFAPQLLAFPHYAEAGDSQIWSETPIDQATLEKVMARAETLVSASPIAREREPRRIFLTDGSWRWLWLANIYRGTFALTRFGGQNLIVNRADFAADRIVNNRNIGGSRKLSAVLAHEITHGVLVHHFGPIAMMRQPRWRVEGYCDHVARESALTPEEVARIEARGEKHPALLYYHGRKRVEAALAASGGSVDALFARE